MKILNRQNIGGTLSQKLHSQILTNANLIPNSFFINVNFNDITHNPKEKGGNLT